MREPARKIKLLVIQDADGRRPERKLPATRADCATGPRPCPYVSCRYHLYLDVTTNGSIQFNFPELYEYGPLAMTTASCALDVAEKGGLILDEIGVLLGGVTREWCRQLEERALGILRGDPIIQEIGSGLTHPEGFFEDGTSEDE